jgi:hypothetical protein
MVKLATNSRTTRTHAKIEGAKKKRVEEPAKVVYFARSREPMIEIASREGANLAKVKRAAFNRKLKIFPGWSLRLSTTPSRRKSRLCGGLQRELPLGVSKGLRVLRT